MAGGDDVFQDPGLNPVEEIVRGTKPGEPAPLVHLCFADVSCRPTLILEALEMQR